MTPPSEPSRPKAFFLSPENPTAGWGGGGLRSSSLLTYLQLHYDVDLFQFDLRKHSKSTSARVRRNAVRFLQGAPPLFDRFAGYEGQLASKLAKKHYDLAIIEHFWCASYAPLLRKHARKLVLDLHNIESELARTHARSVRWPISWASSRFAEAYRKLEHQWLPQFDTLLVTSEDDRLRVRHKDVHVYPNALPVIPRPNEPEEDCIVFSGNLEYHPNIEAVRWFRRAIWPLIEAQRPDLEWRLVGRNPEAIRKIVDGSPRIRVIGPVDDAVRELARAKVCVVPLLSGSGTRFKILEAWAAERAVVSTRLGAEGLGAKNGEHVSIADNPESFTTAVLHLLNDSAQRTHQAKSGRALYESNFTWPQAWKSLPL
jgi:glycosyltransferase involved in cell wall biosynthesis